MEVIDAGREVGVDRLRASQADAAAATDNVGLTLKPQLTFSVPLRGKRQEVLKIV
jgi:hypothetical protein